MLAKPSLPQTREMFRQPLDEMINLNHPLCRLGRLIDWSVLEKAWAKHFPSKFGRPSTPARLIAGLLYLQHTFSHSDETLLATWLENPYWQYFCGLNYFEYQMPIDPSSLCRWRKRLGEEGIELMLSITIVAAQRLKLVKESSFSKVIVDTTVMEKAIAYPTDSQLYEKSRIALVKFAKRANLKLRQNYNREAPKLAGKVGRYAHAKQFQRMRASLRQLRGYTGRVMRDIERQLGKITDPRLRSRGEKLIEIVRKIFEQKPKDQNKIYSLHEPEVQCISKGKAHKRYEFGQKVTVATTHKEGLVVGIKALFDNPYDGHTLKDALNQIKKLTNKEPTDVFVDKGYKGHQIKTCRVWLSGQRKGVTAYMKKLIKRRSSIEPIIGHMKNDGRLRRTWLKGTTGDAIHAILCGAGHNLRFILRALWLCFVLFLTVWIEKWRELCCQQEMRYRVFA